MGIWEKLCRRDVGSTLSAALSSLFEVGRKPASKTRSPFPGSRWRAANALFRWLFLSPPRGSFGQRRLAGGGSFSRANPGDHVHAINFVVAECELLPQPQIAQRSIDFALDDNFAIVSQVEPFFSYQVLGPHHSTRGVDGIECAHVRCAGLLDSPGHGRIMRSLINHGDGMSDPHIV